MTIVLLVLGMRFDDYAPAKNIIVWFLGPATVGLAAPLDKNRHTLVRHALPAFVGLARGSLSTLSIAVLLAKTFALARNILASISIKSVMAPMAIELATIVEANPSLTTVFVIATGMIGAMFGPWLMRISCIYNPLARALALGTISHGHGIAQAVIQRELQGAAVGVAMGLAAVFTSCIAPYLVPFLV